ncbi:hypothetical protein SLS54_009431 [Diplodia seriata]
MELSLSPTGVLKPGSSPVDGIFDQSKDKSMYPGVGAATNPGKKTGDTAATSVDLAIKTFSTGGDDTMALRTFLKNSTPGNKEIKVYYDQIFLRYGRLTVITACVPIGDVSLEGEGLIYLEGGMFPGENYGEVQQGRLTAGRRCRR